MRRESDVGLAVVLWMALLSLSGTIILAPLFPELMDKETACQIIYGRND